MSGGKKVNANVVVFDQVTGERHFIEAGEVPPAELREQLGDHLFVKVDDEDTAVPKTVETPGAEVPASPDGDEAPPRSGRGSGRDEWAAYAAAHGVDVEDDQSRDDIVKALEAAGVVAGE